MKLSRARYVVLAAVIVVISLGLVFNAGTGTLSAFGWRDVSLLCPLGAFTSMLSAKTVFPRAIIALSLVVVIVLLSGRAFCSWACPVPLVSKLREAFRRKSRTAEELRADGVTAQSLEAGGAEVKGLTQEEQALLRGGTEAGCAACSRRFPRFDSRHMVLGGAVLSAAIFGFPVFCLVCPIGLTFGSILLIIALFGYGDVTWSVVFIPIVLLVEVVFFRKWCSKICPMGAFLSLLSKLNLTFRPTIDKGKCLETTRGARCGICTKSCEQGVNLRDDSLGAAKCECTRCFACVDNCPTGAIRVPFLPRRASAPRASGGVGAALSQAEGEQGTGREASDGENGR